MNNLHPYESLSRHLITFWNTQPLTTSKLQLIPTAWATINGFDLCNMAYASQIKPIMLKSNHVMTASPGALLCQALMICGITAMLPPTPTTYAIRSTCFVRRRLDMWRWWIIAKWLGCDMFVLDFHFKSYQKHNKNQHFEKCWFDVVIILVTSRRI